MLEVTSVQFTVGKLDAGMAILLSPNHHLIEFPATILPEGITTGSIVNVTIERNVEEELRQREEFFALQEDIFKSFSKPPEPPVIRCKAVTQTSATITWNPLVLHEAVVRNIEVYRNGNKLNLNVQPNATSAKLSGLEINHEYEIFIVVRTSAGALTSPTIVVKTHAMENLTGINVCFGDFSHDQDIDALVSLLNRVGAKYSDELTLDNTHLVCTIPKGPKYEKALDWNIPIVSPEWLKACEAQKKIQPAHSFYISNQTPGKSSGDGK
ncbi:Chitin synthase, class 5 [Nowakowskiella sp. JEL0407]|nr:Chitin synthase, class 5 [Nowakowskiella sp. JEL0407]